MKEYDVYLPLSYNDGRPVEPEKISKSKALLLKEFGGLTHFPQENEGLWKLGRITFRDKVVILRVLSDEPEKARAFLSGFRTEMQRDLDQEELLIVEREVQAVR